MSAVQPVFPGFELCLRDALADCVSKFHQLMVIVSFRDPTTGFYEYPDSGMVLVPQDADYVQRMHSLVFEEWLTLSLTEQSYEITTYLSNLEARDRRVLRRMLSIPAACESLAPSNATPEARQLMSSDLQMLISR